MPNIYFIFNLDDLIYLKNLIDFYIESLHKQLSYNYTLFFNKLFHALITIIKGEFDDISTYR